MGALARFRWDDSIRKFGLRAYVETGCGCGNSLETAARHEEFEVLRACEIEPLMAISAIARFAGDRRIEISRMASEPFIAAALRDLPPALIFLDAHFPGADFGLRDYAAEPDEALRMPLAREILAISRLGRSGDVILIDDLRLYEPIACDAGPLPDGIAAPKPGGADFLVSLMGVTHEATRIPRDTGYLLLHPRR